MYPKIKSYINKRIISDKLLLSQLDQRLIFSGKSTSVISNLVDNMDGKKSLNELANQFNLELGAIQDLVSYLEEEGYLYQQEQKTDNYFSEISENLSNLAYAEFFNLGIEDIYKVLNKKLSIITSSSSAKLNYYFNEIGFSNVDIISVDQINNDIDLLIVDSEKHELLNEINRYCIKYEIPWLKYSTSLNKINIGPIFKYPITSCYSCFTNRRISNDEFFNLDFINEKDYLITFPPNDVISLGLVMNEIYKFFLSIDKCMILGNQYEIDLVTLDSHLRPVYKLPFCSSCSRKNIEPMYADIVSESGVNND